jgi:L-tyrosine isonitrile synthase
MDNRNIGTAKGPSSEMLARFEPARRDSARSSPPPAPASQAEAIVQAFNSWAFKREQPDSAEKLKRLALLAIEQAAPLGFVLYWGRGPRADVAAPERRCLEYLTALIRRVETRHAPGAEVTLICTDTHARLNGYGALSTQHYFAQVTAEAGLHGFKTCFLSDLVRWAEDRIDETRALEPPPQDTLAGLAASAAKWYRGDGSVEEGARRYYSANMIERQAVEAAFPRAVFVTFNGSDLRPLFPENMPVFYMYSLRRGMAVKPWFMAEEEEFDDARREAVP